MEPSDTESIQTTQYSVYIKPILTYNFKAWPLAKKNERKVQSMDTNIVKGIQGEREGKELLIKMFNF
jgi:hypothetical protein